MAVKIVRAYADTSIGQIHYRYAGEGKNLVLLHPSPTCSEVYEPVMRLLAPDFHVIAMDTPGWGMSPWLPPHFTIPDVARVTVEFLDALKIRKTSIFGHYTGGCTAVEIAATRPGRVEKLIVSGPVNYDPLTRSQRVARAFARPTFTEDGSFLKRFWDGLSAESMSAPGKPVDLEAKHRSLVWRLEAEPRVIEFPRAVFSYDMASRLPKIKAPTLVVAGENDGMRDAMEPTARAIKGARHYLIPKGSARVMLQQPEVLAKIIRDFLLG